MKMVENDHQKRILRSTDPPFKRATTRWVFLNSRDRLAFIADHAAEPSGHGRFEPFPLPALSAGAEVISLNCVIIRLRSLDWRPLSWGTVFVECA